VILLLFRKTDRSSRRFIDRPQSENCHVPIAVQPETQPHSVEPHPTKLARKMRREAERFRVSGGGVADRFERDGRADCRAASIMGR
jgi:hypothetical protein